MLDGIGEWRVGEKLICCGWWLIVDDGVLLVDGSVLIEVLSIDDVNRLLKIRSVYIYVRLIPYI